MRRSVWNHLKKSWWMASDAAIGPFLELGQIWCERLVHSSSRFTMCASSPPKLPSDHSLRRRRVTWLMSSQKPITASAQVDVLSRERDFEVIIMSFQWIILPLSLDQDLSCEMTKTSCRFLEKWLTEEWIVKEVLQQQDPDLVFSVGFVLLLSYHYY